MKTISFLAATLFSTLTIFGHQFQQSDSARKLITESDLKNDFRLFRQALQEAHPGLYRYSTKHQFDSIFSRTFRQIDNCMTQQQFYRLLLPVVNQIKCGHTKLHPDENWITNFFFNSEHVFPWRLHFEGNKAFILGSYTNPTNDLPIGAELVFINGKPVSELIPEMLSAFVSDGNNITFKYIELSRFFSACYANLYEGPDTFIIGYKEEDIINEIKLPSIPHADIIRYEKQEEVFRAKQSPYSLDFMSRETALLTISSFWLESDEIKYKRFLQQSFKRINEKKITNLIIDLRNNEGGVDKRGALLLSYLMDQEFSYYKRLELTTRSRFSFKEHARLPGLYGILRFLVAREDDGKYIWRFSKNLKVQKPQKNNYTGKVYVLINGASFSVTAEFAAVTHYLKRATFIGEETGGGYYGNNSGAFAVVTLPHSRLNIGIPLMAYYLHVDGYAYPSHGVIPDFEIKPSASDIISAKDVVLDFTLKHIESQMESNHNSMNAF